MLINAIQLEDILPTFGVSAPMLSYCLPRKKIPVLGFVDEVEASFLIVEIECDYGASLSLWLNILQMAKTAKPGIHHPIGVDNHDHLLYCTVSHCHHGLLPQLA